MSHHTTVLPSSLGHGVCRLRVVPEEDNFILADAHIQLHGVHPGGDAGRGGGSRVLTGSLGRTSGEVG